MASEAYQYYSDFCEKNGFKAVAVNKFGMYANAYVENKRVRVNCKREYRYFLKEGVSFEDEDEEDIIDLDAKGAVGI